MSGEMQSNGGSKPSDAADSLHFSLLVTPPPMAEAVSAFSIDTGQVQSSPSFESLTLPPPAPTISLDRYTAARWGLPGLTASSPLAQELAELQERLTESLSHARIDFGPPDEMIPHRDIRSFCETPGTINLFETINCIEFHWEETGEFFLPDLREALDPTFTLIHLEDEELEGERFSSGPVRLLAVWDERTQEFSRMSALLSQECIEEAIGHFVECLRRMPNASSASCLFHRFESSLIDLLMASGVLDDSISYEQAGRALRRECTYEILSFGLADLKSHTFRISAVWEGPPKGDLVPLVLHSEITIPADRPIELEDVVVRWHTPGHRTT